MEALPGKSLPSAGARTLKAGHPLLVKSATPFPHQNKARRPLPLLDVGDGRRPIPSCRKCRKAPGQVGWKP